MVSVKAISSFGWSNLKLLPMSPSAYILYFPSLILLTEKCPFLSVLVIRSKGFLINAESDKSLCIPTTIPDNGLRSEAFMSVPDICSESIVLPVENEKV